MAANLTSESENTDRVVKLVNECRMLDLNIVPPDINRSKVGFFARKNAVYFGLNAIKNVGKKAAFSIVNNCEKDGIYKSIKYLVIANYPGQN